MLVAVSRAIDLPFLLYIRGVFAFIALAAWTTKDGLDKARSAQAPKKSSTGVLSPRLVGSHVERVASAQLPASSSCSNTSIGLYGEIATSGRWYWMRYGSR